MHLYREPADVVQCPKCRKFWKPGNTACLVLHHGDGCCHYGDTEVTDLEAVTKAAGLPTVLTQEQAQERLAAARPGENVDFRGALILMTDPPLRMPAGIGIWNATMTSEVSA